MVATNDGVGAAVVANGQSHNTTRERTDRGASAPALRSGPHPRQAQVGADRLPSSRPARPEGQLSVATGARHKSRSSRHLARLLARRSTCGAARRRLVGAGKRHGAPGQCPQGHTAYATAATGTASPAAAHRR